MTTTVDRLRGLLERATKGPWTVALADSEKFMSSVFYFRDGAELPETVALVGPDDVILGHPRLAVQNANAALIVEAINALPMLLDAVEALKGAIELLDDLDIAHPLKWNNALSALTESPRS